MLSVLCSADGKAGTADRYSGQDYGISLRVLRKRIYYDEKYPQRHYLSGDDGYHAFGGAVCAVHQGNACVWAGLRPAGSAAVTGVCGGVPVRSHIQRRGAHIVWAGGSHSRSRSHCLRSRPRVRLGG